MNTVYRLQSDELTPDLIALIKASYPHKEIEIIVDEVIDETEYLMSSPANKSHLEAAMRNVENHINLIEVKPESIES